MRDPIFIVGNSRSGTTLMAGILSRHPDVYFLHETHFMEELAVHIRHPDAFAKLSRAELTALVNRMLTIQHKDYPRRAELENYPEEAEPILMRYEAAAEHERPTAFLLVRSLMDEEAARHEATIAGDQTPRHIFNMPELHRAFRGGRFLHLIRDPRAITLSQKKKGKAARASDQPLFERLRVRANYHPVTMALLWKRVMEEGRRGESAMPTGAYMFLRFEDLCIEPERSVRSVCDFLDLEFIKDMLEVDECVSSNLGRVPYMGINPAVVGQWRGRQSKTETWLVEWIAGEEMSRLEYEPLNPRPNPMVLLAYLGIWPFHLALAFVLNVARMGNALTYVAHRFFRSRAAA